MALWMAFDKRLILGEIFFSDKFYQGFETPILPNSYNLSDSSITLISAIVKRKPRRIQNLSCTYLRKGLGCFHVEGMCAGKVSKGEHTHHAPRLSHRQAANLL